MKKIGEDGLLKLLKYHYPDHAWDYALLFRGRYSQQRRLEKCVAGLFPVRFFLFLLLKYFTFDKNIYTSLPVICIGYRTHHKCPKRSGGHQSTNGGLLRIGFVSTESKTCFGISGYYKIFHTTFILTYYYNRISITTPVCTNL